MKIKATTKIEFDKQYYSQNNNKNIEDIQIELETDDSFWKELTEEQIKKQLDFISFFNKEVNKIDSEKIQFKNVFIEPYGSIIRV